MISNFDQSLSPHCEKFVETKEARSYLRDVSEIPGQRNPVSEVYKTLAFFHDSMNIFLIQYQRNKPKNESQWLSHYHQSPRASSVTIESSRPQQACEYPLYVLVQ